MLRAQDWRSGLLLTSVFLAGCGPALPPGAKPTKPVKVTVTYQGKPVDNAVITFIMQGDDPVRANGKTDAQGVARLTTYIEGDGAPIGAHKVMISKVETIGEPPSVDQNSPDYKSPTGSEPPPVTKYLVPAKYGEFSKTDLAAEVKSSGANEFTFDLKD